MTAPLCFIDTETTGVHPGRRPWEIAMIRREPDGTETEKVLQISHMDLSGADPFGLKVGRFYERHLEATTHWNGPIVASRAPGAANLVDEREAARTVEVMTRGAHLVGAVPNFDAETLDPMLRRHGLLPAWHYHLIDVEALAVGYLAAHHQMLGGGPTVAGAACSLPWKSDDLSRACGVEPASDDERHTALGDARWAMRIFDAITRGEAA